MALWGNKDSKTATGTLAIGTDGAVTGSSTEFTTEAAVGDYIIADGVNYRITAIESDTAATVAAGVLGGAIAEVTSGTSYALSEKPIYTSASEVGSNANAVFGVDTTEAGVEAGGLAQIIITNPGSGYFANATVTVAGGGGSSGAANAQANATGRISVVNITTAGSSYETNPTITIAAPAAQAFNAETAVAANGFIAIASNKFQVNDRVRYLVAAGNTAIAELANNTQYYVKAANTTGVYLAATPGGTAITLTDGPDETGHTLTGETATAVAVVGGAKNKGVAHAGWVKRTVGTGGRAGRVQYETLVAAGTITNDASDDTVLPDA